jgi:hypothetical protein
MKKWIDDHVALLMFIILILIGIGVLYLVYTNMCWTCPSTNMTGGI